MKLAQTDSFLVRQAYGKTLGIPGCVSWLVDILKMYRPLKRPTLIPSKFSAVPIVEIHDADAMHFHRRCYGLCIFIPTPKVES